MTTTSTTTLRGHRIWLLPGGRHRLELVWQGRGLLALIGRYWPGRHD